MTHVLALLSLLLSLGISDQPEGPFRPVTRVKVLTFNIHHGEGVDGKIDLARIAKVIDDSDADVVALQEVDLKTRRSGGIDQAAELAKLTGMHAHFGKAIDFQGGAYGNAILSRFPTTRPATLPLTAEAPREGRCALTVEVTHPRTDARFTFTATHLDHLQDDAARLGQVKQINEKLAGTAEGRAGLPALLAGDLNATPDSAAIRILAERWGDPAAAGAAPTYPSDNPRKRIDYVLCRPRGAWRLVAAKAIDEKIASDHRPVLVILDLRPPAP